MDNPSVLHNGYLSDGHACHLNVRFFVGKHTFPLTMGFFF